MNPDIFCSVFLICIFFTFVLYDKTDIEYDTYRKPGGIWDIAVHL